MEAGSPNRSISAEDSGHYNFLVGCSVRCLIALGVCLPALVATALWAVSTCECITELDRPQAGGYSTKGKKSAREVFAGACSFYLENNSVATASS